MTHKYIDEELDAQEDIKEAGFRIFVEIVDERNSENPGPAYNPNFRGVFTFPFYALDVTSDAKFIKSVSAESFEKILMVSTEKLPTSAGLLRTYERPAVGLKVKYKTITENGTTTTTEEFQIVELQELAPAGVPIFYTFVLDGRGVNRGS